MYAEEHMNTHRRLSHVDKIILQIKQSMPAGLKKSEVLEWLGFQVGSGIYSEFGMY